jgi:hypothetical protein
MFTSPADALHPGTLTKDESDHPIVTAGVVAVAALVMLAGRLSGHAKPGSDLRPSDAQADGVIDQNREFRLRLLLRNPGARDPLQHLGRGNPGDSLRQA